ncbi:hypothetical protein EYF80_009200 [Liparis tanakae]|uniref:Uncharacterized protein n=1 Tax=Liparis tanakae TaxID=230148 RepID=A0A4Z2IRJ6_9TELE|nr:hypothetical protein EYF80_009200 [Liparis tanakae]
MICNVPVGWEGPRGQEAKSSGNMCPSNDSCDTCAPRVLLSKHLKGSRHVEGVEASRPVVALLCSTDSDRCLHSDNRRALSLPRSLLKADPSPTVRGLVTPDASESASFTEEVKSVQGAGLRSGSGEVAEERESLEGVNTLFDAGDRRPRAGA